jgi:ketosteroid isomerase-like protein
MSNANIEAVQTIYEAFGTGDVDTILGMLADEVDFGSEAAQDIAPWHGRRTKAEVPAFSRRSTRTST